jgi:thymidylate kinase
LWREGTVKLKVVILGPDGAGKSSVIGGLLERLSPERRIVTMRHLKPRLVADLRGQPSVLVVDPHGKPPRGAFLSLLKIWVWLIEEWYEFFFYEKRTMLMICDRYYHDLLIDPMRYRFGAPMWMARLVGSLMPKPRLWVLLNAPPDVLQTRKQEVAPEETARQCVAYLTFIRKQRYHTVVDATQPMRDVIAEVEQAIMRAMPEKGGHAR